MVKLLEKLLNFKMHLRFVITPIIKYNSNLMSKYKGICPIKRDTPIIVSLTSYEARFKDLEISLYSLLNQSLKPDKIILWLSDEFKSINDLPYEITKYIKNGLEIRFVKDIGSYTKVIYTLKEFPEAIIVTADDDIYYPKKWLEKLYHSYIAHPKDIQVHRAHRVKIKDNKILPYEKWDKHVLEESARFDNFLTGVGGVLYPPKCFIPEVFRYDIFLKYAPTADDIWLWFMALISNRKIRVVQNHIKTLNCINIMRQILPNRKTLYSINSTGRNDEQIKHLMKFYQHNIMQKINI